MANSILVGNIENGVYTKNAASKEATKTDSGTNSSLSSAAGKTSYDKEMFLQLLTAEMQYQDPLEPTSNSEYVAELASFSQIEAIQSVQSQMQSIQANSLVGKYVVLLDEDNNYVTGKVDYVSTDESGELQLAVNDKLYGIDTLDSVVDEEYFNGSILSESFAEEFSKLPSVEDCTLADEKAIMDCYEFYSSISDSYKKYIPAESVMKLSELVNRINSLKNPS